MYKSIQISFILFCLSWNLQAQDVSSYQKALVEQRDKPVGIYQKEGIIGLDFGKAFFGKLKINVQALAEGDTVIVRLGEKWVSDHLDIQPGGTIRATTDTFVKKGEESYVYFPLKKDKRNTSGRAVLLPSSFGVILPFRAAEIISSKQIDFRAERVYYHYPFDKKEAYIHTSHPLLDSILQLCMHSIKATSFAGVYVDGDRERIPYEADALINQLSHYVIDTNSHSIAQHTIEYLMSHPSWPTEWHLQMHQLVWNDYAYTGNTAILKKYYDFLAKKTLMAFEYKDDLISTTGNPQSTAFLRSIHYSTFDAKDGLRDITDWPQKGNIPEEPSYQGESDGFVFCTLNSVVNAYYYQSLLLMKKFAEILGKKDDVVFYHQKAEKVKASFRRYFLDTTTNHFVDGYGTTHQSLHANAFALAFGLVEAKEKNAVLALLLSKGMACSVYGAQFLFEGLIREGKAEEVLALITNRTSRSWYQMILNGATITTEAWDKKYKPNLDWNHAWGTAPLNTMVIGIMGIKPSSSNEYIIEPQKTSLTYISAGLPIGKGWLNYQLTTQNNRHVLMLRVTGSVGVKCKLAGTLTTLKAGQPYSFIVN